MNYKDATNELLQINLKMPIIDNAKLRVWVKNQPGTFEDLESHREKLKIFCLEHSLDLEESWTAVNNCDLRFYTWFIKYDDRRIELEKIIDS